MMRSVRSALPLLLALAVAGCPTIGSHTVELPVRLTVAPSDTLRPGETLRMTAYLRNPGRDSVRLEFDDQCQVEFYVHAPDKTVLHPPGGGTTCVQAPSVIELAPGDSVRFAEAWRVSASNIGPHTAYAVLWDHHVPRRGERRFEAGHRSNIVQFEIVHEP